MKINGLKVIIANTTPRMTLSSKVCVTDEFRAEMNAWMLQFFGYTCPLPRGEILVLKANHTMIVHPADYADLRATLSSEEPTQ